MSDLRVSTIRTRKGDSLKLPDGAVVTGVTTATSFIGNLTGAVVGDVDGNISGTTGSFTGAVSGASGSFSSDVSVGGTVTYEDVSSVDSVGVITARDGIRVGAGESIGSDGAAVVYYGDGSNLSGVESGVVNFVASGTISNGATVIIKPDGTVGIVTATVNPAGYGSAVEYSPDSVNHVSSTPVGSNKFVIAYADEGNSNYGTAIVGEVSGTDITFGSEVVFESAGVYFVAATYDSTNDRVVISYRDDGNSNYGTSVVGTVSGTSISFGTPVVYESSTAQYQATTFDSTNGKVIVVYRHSSNTAQGTAIVGTVSGTSISFGSPTSFGTGSSTLYSATYDSTNERVVISYRDGANSNYGTSVVGTVSGTSISFGTPVVFNSGGLTHVCSSVFDSANGKVVLFYADYSDSGKLTSIVGTVSGTSISFGTAVLCDDTTQDPAGKAAYDSVNGKIVIAFEDSTNSYYGTSKLGTVSGTSISFSDELVFDSSNTAHIGAAYLGSGHVAVNYQQSAKVYKVAATSTTNLTTENYIGIAAEAISNGATGKVNVVSGTNTGQTGLTTAQTYYVQNNGSLGTSADDPSVVAGTAISSTKIIVS